MSSIATYGRGAPLKLLSDVVNGAVGDVFPMNRSFSSTITIHVERSVTTGALTLVLQGRPDGSSQWANVQTVDENDHGTNTTATINLVTSFPEMRARVNALGGGTVSCWVWN